MKIIYQILAFAVVLGISAWIFNHINPWIGIALFIVYLLILINHILKQIKQIKNEN